MVIKIFIITNYRLIERIKNQSIINLQIGNNDILHVRGYISLS